MPDGRVVEVTVGAQGRVVVPAQLRRQLGIEPGDVLIARAQDDRLVLERREAILARTRKRYAHLPPDVSLAEDLIQQRRAEAARERES